MMNHMLMADVAYLNAGAFERIGICFPLFAEAATMSNKSLAFVSSCIA